MIEEHHFKVGDRVQKVNGYRYPGVVVSAFHSLGGKARYVVEADAPEFIGMLHIYSGSQLELRS